MKRTYGLLAAICLVTLSACFSPWSDGEGTITIAFGAADPGGRVAIQDDDTDDLTHRVTLTSPGRVPVEGYFPGRGSMTFTVDPGVWAIEIRTYSSPELYNAANASLALGALQGNNRFPSEMLRAIGVGQAEVIAGRNATPTIPMISAVEVANQAQLRRAISLARTDGAGRADGGEKIIFITESFTVSDTFNIEAGTVNITLASTEEDGVTITRAQNNTGVMFHVEGKGNTLRLGRPGMSGSITIDGGRPGITATGSIIEVRAGATLEMNRGVTLTGNAGNNVLLGGAVHVGADGTFVMRGGVVSNNRAAYGGGVYVDGNAERFEKTGGVIYGSGESVPSDSANTATGRGNAVFISDMEDVLFYDETVRGTQTHPVIWQRELDTVEPTIIVNADITVVAPVAGQTQATTATAVGDNFTVTEVLWNPDNGVFLHGTEYTVTITLTARESYTFADGLTGNVTINGNTVTPEIADNGRTAALSHTFAKTEDAPSAVSVSRDGAAPAWFGRLEEALDTITGTGAYTVTVYQDQELAPRALNTGAIITLQGGGAERGITLAAPGSLFTVGSGTLTLGNITLRGMGMAIPNNAPLVFVESAGTLVMNAGAIITGNYNIKSGTVVDGWLSLGGGVRVAGTFNMNTGATISDNRAVAADDASSGGGVFVVGGGVFTMSGGYIRGNHAGEWGGGGVLVDGNSAFTMTGGTIEENEASGGGGGVHVSAHGLASGTFAMSGGTIRSNTAYGGGGGVFVNVYDTDVNGRFTMSGGEIRGNTALGTEGGGVFVDGIFDMTGGTIEDNEATGAGGGGVFVARGRFVMENVSARITGNTASNNAGEGGGVRIGEDGEFVMRAGTISDNVAVDGGGAHVASGGTFDMVGQAEVSGNSATGNGGGVSVDAYGTLRMENGLISSNNAPQSRELRNLGGAYHGTFNADGMFTSTGELSSTDNRIEVRNGVLVVQGSAAHPFEIRDAADLRRIGTGDNHRGGDWTLYAHYVLVNNITLSGNGWVPIGSETFPFIGSFDGGDRIITGLRINAATNLQGMFGAIGDGGEVRNLALAEVSITGAGLTGGLAGMNYGKIESVSVSGSVTGTNDTVGGLVGSNRGGEIANASHSGSVRGVRQVGGVVGLNDAGSVTNSFATGDVSGSDRVGGLVGENLFRSSVTSSFATGNVTGADDVGGLVGRNSSSTVTNSFATGNVAGDDNVGGVVGLNTGDNLDGNIVGGTVRDSFATGNVTGVNYVGGVVGASLSNDSLQNIVALNPSITAESTYRVLGAGSANHMISNFARYDMRINGNLVTTGIGADTRQGANTNATTNWHNAEWWLGLGFPAGIWDIANGRLPRLRNMPPEAVQNHAVQ